MNKEAIILAIEMLSEEEAIRVIVSSACDFIEDGFDDSMVYKAFVNQRGFRYEYCVAMHPSSGDKLIFRTLARQAIKEIPEDYRDEQFCKRLGTYLILDEFCWLYNAGNRLYND